MAGKSSAAKEQARGKVKKNGAAKEGAGYAYNICGIFVSLEEASKRKPDDLICCGKSMSQHEDYFD